MEDLRPKYFGGLDWYESLARPESGQDPSAWYVAKETDGRWYSQALNAALALGDEQGLTAEYQQRFAGISRADLQLERALANGWTVTFPIWVIANELLVARYLQEVTDWTVLEHEPPGRHARRGDWLFRSAAGERVFVEVKTLREPERLGTGVFTRPDFRPRVRRSLARGYQQLPSDGSSTLIVLVNNFILEVPYGIMHGDLFQALFGQMQITFNVMPYDPESVQVGPSFWDMFVHGSKHRRLGCAAGMAVSGLFQPSLTFYVIHNPYAHDPVRLTRDDFPNVWQFQVDDEGQGREYLGISADDAWARIASGSERREAG